MEQSKSPLKLYLKLVSKEEEQEYKYKTNEEVELARKNWELDNEKDKAEKRNFLSKWLLGISISWLIFTAFVIFAIGKSWLYYGDLPVVTFISGSLLEVFGLWKIALNYFFDNGRK